MSKPLADQLLTMGMPEINIGLALARLNDERYDLTATEILAFIEAPSRIQAIEAFIWSHLNPQFRGRTFALSPEFLRAHVDWGSAWRSLRQGYGMGCVQMPKEADQALVQFLFVAGPCALSPTPRDLRPDGGESCCNKT